MDKKIQKTTGKKNAVKLLEKGKVNKPKAVSVKTKIKGVPTKRPKTAVSKKTKPAARVEPGYCLYSSLSEDSTVQEKETCSKVLSMLKERRTETECHRLNSFQTPFNDRLSSSTPDPDRMYIDLGEQMIPERDTSTPLWKSVLQEQELSTNKEIDIHLRQLMMNGGSHYQTSGIRIPTAHSVTMKTPSTHQTDNILNSITQGHMENPVLQTYSQGFVPSAESRDSDIGAFQNFIDRDFVTLVPKADQLQQSYSGVGDKTGNFTTPDTTQSGYITLPKPTGNADVPSQQSTMPVYMQQNGLYQLRPQLHNVQNILQPSEVTNNHPSKLFERYMTGQEKYPSPVADLHDNQPRFECSYLGLQQYQSLPENSAPSGPIPMLNLSDRHITDNSNSQGTLSSINGSGVHSVDTPTSQRTAASSTSPRSNPSVTPKNSSGSSSSKSVTFHQNDVSKSTKASQTQTDENSTGQQFMHIGQSSTQQIHLHPGQAWTQTSSAESDISEKKKQIKSIPGQYKSAEKEDDSQLVTSLVQSDVPNPWSGVKAKAGMKKLRYCLKELKECGKLSKDKEINRLVKEVEQTLETIPHLKSTFSLQAEIDLSLQPLRSENAQLRRRLRLLSKQVKVSDDEKGRKVPVKDDEESFLRTKITSLQRNLVEEKELKVKLAGEMKEMHTQIQKMKTEKNKLLASLSEKETVEMRVRQECLNEAHHFREDLERLQRQIQGARMQHEALERENHILQITLQQRDGEIKRQEDIVEGIKDTIGQVLQDLETSRTAGNMSHLSNNSFSLQKLLLQLQGKASKSLERSVLSDPGQQSSLQISHHTKFNRNSPLTEDILRTHNRLQPPSTENKSEYNGLCVSNNEGNYKASTSDTEVEYHTFDSHKNVRRKSASARCRSLSGDSSLFLHNHGNDWNSKPMKEEKLQKQSEKHLPLQYQKLRFKDEDEPLFYQKKPIQNKSSVNPYEDRSDIDNHSKFSMAESRYSVTDYFQKYPKNPPALHSRTKMNNTSLSQDHSVRIKQDEKPHRRSLSQPETVALNQDDQSTFSKFYSPKKLSFQSTLTQHSLPLKPVTSPQEQLFQGTVLDNSISAIDDDNISSVSEKSPSTASTVDDKTFRKGIATLDANILKLQLALQKTKSMLS